MRPFPLCLLVLLVPVHAALLTTLPDAKAGTAVEPCVSCRYTGAQLVKDYFPPKQATKGDSYRRHVEAWAYIDGVYDGAEGREWCNPRKVRINADELAGDVAWGLKELPPDVLKGNAAPLIVDHLRKKFPCELRALEAPRFSGSRLATDYSDKSNAEVFKMAAGYIDGVYDTSEGRDWCYPGRVKPDDLAGDIANALRELPPDVLNGNAAPLIVRYLSQKYPCTQ